MSFISLPYGLAAARAWKGFGAGGRESSRSGQALDANVVKGDRGRAPHAEEGVVLGEVAQASRTGPPLPHSGGPEVRPYARIRAR